MKHSLTLILLIAALMTALALPTPALADGGEGGLTFTQTIDGYTVNLVFQSTPVVGENPIHIQILDAAGMPVSGADVEVSIEKAEAGHDEEEKSDAESGHAEESASGIESGHDEEAPTSAPDSMSGMGGMSTEPTPTPAAMSNVNSMSPVNPSAEHDAMGMTALEAGHEAGEYEGELAIESDGDLIVRAHITIHDEQMEIDFPLHVEKSSAGSIVLSVFAAINTVIIGAAFVLKQKSGSAKLSKKA